MIPFFTAMKESALKDKEACSLGIALNYFLNNYESFILFISNPNISTDNNPAKRGFKSPAIGRKTWYGTHSIRGALTMVIMYTLYESCKLNGVSPRDFMKELVASLHQYKGKNWKKGENFHIEDENQEWNEANQERKKFSFTPKIYKEKLDKKAEASK